MPDPTPVDTPYGTLYVDPEELVIGRLLQENGAIPDISEEVAFFRKYLKPGDTAIDVGANYGLFTLALAQIVGAAGTVHAVEPNPEMWPYLCKTCGYDKEPTLAEHYVMETSFWAAGNQRGRGKLRLDPRGSGGTQVITDADHEEMDDLCIVARLDDIFGEEDVKAIKIDAEGMDVDVLLGASTILKEDRPVVIFEWNPEAMEALGKDPLSEMLNLEWLGMNVKYSIADLDGEQLPNRFLGNIAYLPDELL